MKNFKSLPQLLDFFKDEKTCIQYYESIRWSGKPVCPFCKTDKTPYTTQRGYRCSDKTCDKKFTVKVGTIFGSSKIPFRTWFGAIYLITNHKKGISSLQLASDLNVTQKTAWFLLHRVREMLKIQAPDVLGGEGKEVETDATHIGGKEKNKHAKKKSKDAEGNYVSKKKIVLGLVERDGQVVLKHVKGETTENMVEFITNYVPEGSTVYSDDHKGYHGLGKIYTHETINHTVKCYVAGKVHTNTIENFWSCLKRGLNGIYHQVSEKHLDAYLNEFASRYNNRNLTPEGKFEKFLTKAESRLTYDALISKNVYLKD